MAKLIYSVPASLDGYFEDADGRFDWAAPDEDVHAFVNELERFRDFDALILHGQNMAPLMESIMATGTVSGELLGDLSERLRAQMAGSAVGLFTLYQAL